MKIEETELPSPRDEPSEEFRTAGRPTPGLAGETRVIEGPKVPVFVSPDSHAAYLAGWQAGRRVAEAGPLPGEIARDVVRILDAVPSITDRHISSETRNDL